MNSCLLHLSPATAACPSCGAALCHECAAGGHRCLTRGVEPVGERERLLAAALHLCALLNFALPLIGAAGGGLVESYPHDLPPGKKTSASFLYKATRTMYTRLGFHYERPKGQGNCVMSTVVPAGCAHE